MTHTYTALSDAIVRERSWLFLCRLHVCEDAFTVSCFGTARTTALVKESDVSRQVSGDQTPCQEQFGVIGRNRFPQGSCHGGAWDQRHLQDVTS